MPIKITLPDGQTYDIPTTLYVDAALADVDDAVSALAARVAALEAAAPVEPPAPEPPAPEPPAPEPPAPEPEPGILDDPDARGVNTRFAEPFQPDCIYLDRLRLARSYSWGIRVGAHGAGRLVLRGPDAHNVTVGSMAERNKTFARVAETSPERAVIECDPEGEITLPAGAPIGLWTLVPEEYEGLDPRGYDPRMVEFYANFDCVRTLQLHGTNAIVKHADGVVYLDPERFYQGTDGRQAASLEWGEDDAVKSGAGPQTWVDVLGFVSQCVRSGRTRAWYCNLPHQASTEYARTLGLLARQTLPAGTEALVESGNEIWNGGMAAFRVGQEWASAWRPEDRAPMLGEPGETLGGDAYTSAMLTAARRSAEIGDAFRTGYTGHGPVHTVFAWHGENLWGAESALAWARQFGRIDCLAIAPYFGHGVPIGTLSDDAFVAELGLDLDRVIAEQHAQAIALAERQGVRAIWYEGGQHTIGSGWPGGWDAGAEQAERVLRGVDLGGMYARQVADWTARGGRLPVFYAGLCYSNPAENFGLRPHAYASATAAEQGFRGR